MEVKRIFLSTLLIIGIVLLAIGLFTGASSNVTADDSIDKIKDKNYIDSIRSEDSIETKDDKTKTYISEYKKLIIEDLDGVVLNMDFITPYENKVSSGESVMIAGWFLIDFNDKTEIFEKIDSYSIKDGYEIKSKNYVWKYLVETEITNCYDSSQINNKTGKNETIEKCYDYIKRDWIKFSKIGELPHKNISIGLFTNTIEGEYIEFVPTIEGFEVLEWASFVVDSLISYYKMDDDLSTTVVIDIHGDNDGVLTVNTDTLSTTGIIEKSLDFPNDVTKKINIADGGSLSFTPGTDDYSFSLWAYRDAHDDRATLIADGIDASTSYKLRYDASAGMDLIAYDGGGFAFNLDNVGDHIVAGAWHHFAMSVNTTTVRFYIDGVYVATSLVSPISPGNDGVFIGVSGDGFNPMDGKIDEIGIYGKALTDGGVALTESATGEIGDLYNGGSPPPYSPPSVDCQFSGFVFDEGGSALVGANITVWNQFDVTEFYENTTIGGGEWTLNITNSTNTYMTGAYFNNTLIGQLKQGISGTC